MKILSILSVVSCGLISSDAARSNESLFTDECVCDRDPIKLLCTVVLGKTSTSFPLNKADGTHFTCTCKDGYQQVGDNLWNCEPIDECKMDPNPCPEGACCVDEFPPQKYTCACQPGYEEKASDAQGATLCRKDPTLIPSSAPASPASAPPQQPSSNPTVTHVCEGDCTGDFKECRNGVCQCKPGCFSTNGDNVLANCEDEDECQANYTPKVQCDRPNKATCINANGSYRCACKDGWTDADNHAFPGSNCVNVNECAENLDDCDLSTQLCKDFNPPTKWLHDECCFGKCLLHQTIVMRLAGLISR